MLHVDQTPLYLVEETIQRGSIKGRWKRKVPIVQQMVRQLTSQEWKRSLCCQCGTSIEPNPANMCVPCLRTQVDITEGIPKQAVLYFCKGCERYLRPPAEWVSCALESRELLALCLQKLKGLNRVKLIDASFIWTEPHSKRIKVKLTVHGEVLAGTVLQQVFIVEYTINHQMCEDCHRTEAQDYWRALVQVRQKSENKKTFYYLEQLILKHKAHDHTLGIKPKHEGLDFFYSTEAYARKMVDFLTSVLPCKFQHSKKLISHDIHSNIYNYKFTYSVEIVPLSKDSVVCLPQKLTHQLGGISPLCLVYRVSNAVHIIDPASAQIAEVSGTLFWRYPFSSICNPKQLTEYVVMDIEPIRDKDRKIFPGQGAISSKDVFCLSDFTTCKSCDESLLVPSASVSLAHVSTAMSTGVFTKRHISCCLVHGFFLLVFYISNTSIKNTNKISVHNTLTDILLKFVFYEQFLYKIRNTKYAEMDNSRRLPVFLGNNASGTRHSLSEYFDAVRPLTVDRALALYLELYINKYIVYTHMSQDFSGYSHFPCPYIQVPLHPRVSFHHMLADVEILYNKT
ncbi:hypothetical protein PR048_007035 [Dryococelus australis]|uniref:60S ribosomal export protein NMD3 n=1 Tax=Dryococelus australis TaxID=614101 RepID=A0ABQ9IDR3_9NEOP|nr:hypothetical protein PR048_007035 [Dryococelus australis]